MSLLIILRAFSLRSSFSHLQPAHLFFSPVAAWYCQLPGTCAYCAACPSCEDGPLGTLGGCGYCKTCSPEACPAPQCIAGVDTAPIGGSYRARNSNIRGLILVLDVNSWEINAGPQIPPVVTTAAQCYEVIFPKFAKILPFYPLQATHPPLSQSIFFYAGVQGNTWMQCMVFLL